MHSHTYHTMGTRRQGGYDWWRIPWRVAVGAALGLALVLPSLVQAKTFRCSAGDVPCLIDAINEANANGEANTIRLAAGTYTLTVADSSDPRVGLPDITSPLTLTGRGADTTIIERDASAPSFGILFVAPAGTLTLKRLTLRGGTGVVAVGGAIRNEGTLTLVHTTVTANIAAAGAGGGIFNSGTLTLVHSAVTANRAPFGAGIATVGGTVTIAHSTIANNAFSSLGGGGLAVTGGEVIITASTIAHNGANGGGGILNSDEGCLTPPCGGTVIITGSAITNNASFIAPGGGIANLATMEITNTTIAQNRLSAGRPCGGFPREHGIFNFGTLLLLNSTVVENTDPSACSVGIVDAGGPGTILQNTILARNTGSGGRDCAGTITSLDNNLIGDPTGCTITLQPSDLTGDPGLGDFTDNGRPGKGHFPLLPTSQAIDAGSDAVCPRTDQLGRRRVGPCDIGAIEFRARDDRQPDVDPAAAAQRFQ